MNLSYTLPSDIDTVDKQRKSHGEFLREKMFTQQLKAEVQTLTTYLCFFFFVLL